MENPRVMTTIVIVTTFIVASFAGSDHEQVLFFGQQQCPRMSCVLTPALQYRTLKTAFQEWARHHAMAVRGLLEAEVE